MKPQPGRGFDWIDTDAGPALLCRPLQRHAAHLFTTRAWQLGSPAAEPAVRLAAWHQLADAMQVDADALVRLMQVHGADAVRARRPTPGQPPCEADILLCDDPSLAVAVQAADCVPILLADRRSGAVAAAHAGWRGLAARVPSAAVTAMTAQFGSRPEDLIAAIGPSISAPRYEVGGDVRSRFETAGFRSDQIDRWFPAATREGHWTFDGWASAQDQLADAGVPDDAVFVAGLCTATYPDLLCSYRRDGSRAGRLAAAIRARG
jgi:YfiH family protein